MGGGMRRIEGTTTSMGGPRLEGQRRAVANDLRPRMRPALVAARVDAAAHTLGEPPVTRGRAQLLVAEDDLLADRDDLLGLEADVDAQIAQRAVEPLHVLGQAEDAPVEGSRHIEAAVAAVEAAVAVGNDHLGLRYELAVEVGDARHVRPPLGVDAGHYRSAPRFENRVSWLVMNSSSAACPLSVAFRARAKAPAMSSGRSTRSLQPPMARPRSA